MADTTTASTPHDYAPDLVGVKSRVSWAAIVAGSAVALATFIVLTMLFAAVGISLNEAGVRDPRAIGYGALVAAIVTIVASLFLGGWIAAQLTAGENQREAAIYGVLTWATVTAVTLFLAGTGVRAGYMAFVGGTVVAQNNERVPTVEETLARAGYSQQQIDQFKATVSPATVQAAANDPANQERAREAAMFAAWTALVGTMLSMAAAVGGAMVGRGPNFRLFPVAVVRENRSRLILPGTA
jgi:hypothetical protein